MALDLIRPEVAGTAPASRRASLGGTFRRAAVRAAAASLPDVVHAEAFVDAADEMDAEDEAALDAETADA